MSDQKTQAEKAWERFYSGDYVDVDAIIRNLDDNARILSGLPERRQPDLAEMFDGVKVDV